VAWRISYLHPLRRDDGGVRIVPDQPEAAAEKLRLELRGYTVSEPTRGGVIRLIEKTEEVTGGEAAPALPGRFYKPLIPAK
jgi:hypothetical protein